MTLGLLNLCRTDWSPVVAPAYVRVMGRGRKESRGGDGKRHVRCGGLGVGMPGHFRANRPIPAIPFTCQPEDGPGVSPAVREQTVSSPRQSVLTDVSIDTEQMTRREQAALFTELTVPVTVAVTLCALANDFLQERQLTTPLPPGAVPLRLLTPCVYIVSRWIP